MRFSLIATAVAGLFSLASAQSLSGLPSCAQSCATGAIADSGCASINITCFCTGTAFIKSIAACVSTACDAADQQTTIEFAENLCLSASVTLSNVESLLTAAATSVASSASVSSSVPVTANSTFTTVATTSMASNTSSVLFTNTSSMASSTAASSSAAATSTSKAAADRNVVAFGVGGASILAAIAAMFL